MCILSSPATRWFAVPGGLFFSAMGTRVDAASVTHAFAITLLAIAACHTDGAPLAAGLGQRRMIRRTGLA
jgi:hypothetical protein